MSVPTEFRTLFLEFVRRECAAPECVDSFLFYVREFLIVHCVSEIVPECLRKIGRNSVPDLLSDSAESSPESIRIRERLEASTLTRSEATVLEWVNAPGASTLNQLRDFLLKRDSNIILRATLAPQLLRELL